MLLDPRTRIAVIGGGTMGSGIAQTAAAAGHEVLVIDPLAAALERGRASVSDSLGAMVRKGRIDVERKTAIEQRIRWTGEIGESASCGLAIEAIVEKLEVKRALFADLARVMPGTAVLASNTSSLAIADIAAVVPDPARVVGLHFFNPVPVMKLVEIVSTPATDPVLADSAASLMRVWGKHPIKVADVPGFIVNRVARPYYGEAFAALGEGIPAEIIDHALCAAGGFRMGPLGLADLIGQDVNYAVATTVYEAYHGRTRFKPQPAQRALVEAGTLGRKSGTGVYDYMAELPATPVLAPQSPPAAVSVEGDGMMADLCRSAAMPFEALAPSGNLAIVDGVRIAPSDGRPLSARPDVDVLIDWARDLGTAKALGFTARDARSSAAAASLIQAGRRDALLLPDRPGLLVARTLTQIANAAADALVDGVSDAEGIDAALMLGANYPEGPFAWMQRTGVAPVADMLHNLADALDDDIYQPSVYFSRAEHHEVLLPA